MAPLRHQHSDNDFDYSDHCVNINTQRSFRNWLQQITCDFITWHYLRNTEADGSSHCKLTIWHSLTSEHSNDRSQSSMSLMKANRTLSQQQPGWQHPTSPQMTLPQQTADSIHHNLKEEPSALRSLSIFDSTETEHKMHNGRRPVVEITICM